MFIHVRKKSNNNDAMLYVVSVYTFCNETNCKTEGDQIFGKGHVYPYEGLLFIYEEDDNVALSLITTQ